MGRLAWAVAIWLSAFAVVRAAPMTQPVSENDRPAPASAPATGPDQPVVAKVVFPVEGRTDPAYYWLRRPVGHGPGQRPPLLIALHGTDDTAPQMVDFWAGLQPRVPVVIAAPQGIGPGWRDDDLPMLRAVFAHLREHVSYDPDRVLLAGFSAGGAMSYYLLYKEKLPVTAVAALANYVPPQITADEIRARGPLPVFYAVGMADVNHERMRDGLERLRAAGGNITLHRPRIGHVLDAQVAQAAIEWFFDKCAEHVAAVIAQADQQASRGPAAAALEQIVAQTPWHEPRHVRQATVMLVQVEAPGRQSLAIARQHIAASRPVDAVETLRRIEADYATARLADEARAVRIELQTNPQVQQQLAQRQADQRADAALKMYAGAQQLVARGELREAAERCRHIIQLYDDTPGGQRARALLDMLEKRGSD